MQCFSLAGLNTLDFSKNIPPSGTTDKQTGTDTKKESESSSTETDNNKDQMLLRRKSNLNFEPIEALMRSQSLKSVPTSRPLSALLNNRDSRSESSSAASPPNKTVPVSCCAAWNPERYQLCLGQDVAKEPEREEGERRRLVDRDKTGRRPREEGVVRCSPGVDLSTNPNVTYVTASSIPELRYRVASYTYRQRLILRSKTH